MCSGPSAQEQQAASQTAALSQQLQTQLTEEFQDSTELQSFLTAQLEPMVTNPTGFTSQQIADLQSTLINSVGTQLAATTQQMQQQFATSNEAGLPSGVNAMNQAILKGEATSTEAQGLLGIQTESAELAQQKQAAAISTLAGMNATNLQAAESIGATTSKNIGQQFQEADVMQQQSTQMWGNILSGVLGAGMSFLTGGLSNLTSGLSFFGNPISAAVPAAVTPGGGGGGGGIGF